MSTGERLRVERLTVEEVQLCLNRIPKVVYKEGERGKG